MTEADAVSAEATSDLLRFGWRETARFLKLRAAETGYRLTVSYRPDPVPSRDDLMRRGSALRQLYNSNKPARQLVDRSVAAFARLRPSLRGGPEGMRQEIQQQLELASPSQFIAQSLRDADVVGNGYLRIGTDGGAPRFQCYRPEDIVVDHEGLLLVQAGRHTRLDASVIHHRGLTQPESPYGMSALEPLLFALAQISLAENISEFTHHALQSPSLPEREREQAQRLARLAENLKEQTNERVARLTDPSSRMLFDPVPGMYFTGQELL